jgi:zinc transporter ZupT
VVARMSADVTSAITIASGSVLMSLIAMVGAITLVLPARRLEALLLPLVALAAGSLLGGALFHMLPEGFSQLLPRRGALWIGAGFSTFLVLEQSVHWHHSHRKQTQRSAVAVQPMALLILLGDGLHNFIGGLGITGTYLINPAAGVAAWFAAVLHEIPQELSSDIRFWSSGDTKIGPPDGFLMGGFRRSLDRCFIGWCRVVVVVGLQHPRHWIRVFPQASSLDGGGFWPALSCEEGPPACGRMRPLRRFSLSL